MSHPHQQIDEQAAEWMLRLHEGPFDEEQQQAFERWQQQSPQHAAAAARMQEVIGRMKALRGQQAPARAALDAAFVGGKRVRQRKQALRTLVLAGCLMLPAALVLNSRYAEPWFADIRTGPSDWRTVHLDDQSTLTFNGASAANLHFDSRQRQVELLQGEVLVEVAHDNARPFIVRTAQGSMRALGTRFVVKRVGDSTVLTMLQSRVAAQSADTRQNLEVAAGSQALIETDEVRLLGSVDPQSVDQAWQRHQLVVEDRPLPEVLDELARHRRGHLQYDRAALAGLRVSAVLPLDDTDRALQLVAQGLPVKVRQFTPWLTLINIEK